MLNYRELGELGYAPKKKYGHLKVFPPGFRLPLSVDHATWKQLPLQIQIHYGYHLDPSLGDHALTRQLET